MLHDLNHVWLVKLACGEGFQGVNISSEEGQNTINASQPQVQSLMSSATSAV